MSGNKRRGTVKPQGNRLSGAQRGIAIENASSLDIYI